MADPCWLWGDTLCPRAEKPQQDGRRGKITFRIKPHTCQRCSAGWNIPVGTRTQTPHRETELCLSVSWGGMGQQWTVAGAGALGAADLGMAQALLEEVTIIPAIAPPELTQDWETNSWRAQPESCVHQDPEERSSDPRDWPRLARACPGVSGRGVGQWWPAAGSGHWV